MRFLCLWRLATRPNACQLPPSSLGQLWLGGLRTPRKLPQVAALKWLFENVNECQGAHGGYASPGIGKQAS